MKGENNCSNLPKKKNYSETAVVRVGLTPLIEVGCVWLPAAMESHCGRRLRSGRGGPVTSLFICQTFTSILCVGVAAGHLSLPKILQECLVAGA